MSRIRVLVERLRREVLAPHNHRTYAAAQDRHAALVSCPDLATVLRRLADDREHTYPEREAITRALMQEHQARRGEIWASVLAVAYYPMLSRLRHRIVGDTVARDDLDQLVLTSFIAALRDVPSHIDRLALRLRQRTQRLVFRFIRRERAERHYGLEENELLEESNFLERVGTIVTLEQSEEGARERVAHEFTRIAEGQLPEQSLRLLLATTIGGQKLRTYVARMYPNQPADEQERAYQRMKRTRTRALKRIRKLMTAQAA